MPFKTILNPTKKGSVPTYKVTAKDNPHHVFAFATRKPHALIQAIEINKKKR